MGVSLSIRSLAVSDDEYTLTSLRSLRTFHSTGSGADIKEESLLFDQKREGLRLFCPPLSAGAKVPVHNYIFVLLFVVLRVHCIIFPHLLRSLRPAGFLDLPRILSVLLTGLRFHTSSFLYKVAQNSGVRYARGTLVFRELIFEILSTCVPQKR